MDNKIIIPQIPKKYSIKLRRNSTLDTTKSSFPKNNKKKLYKKLTSLIDISKNASMKQKLNFPVFMSLYTNNTTKKESEEKKKKSINRKFILKNIKNYSMNNILISNKNNSKNELFLPNPKNIIINKNDNGENNGANKPLNLDIHNFLKKFNKNNFQSSRNQSKPKLKKIEQAKLIKFTQRPNPNIKLFIAKKFELTNIKSTKTYDFEISEINKKKKSFKAIIFDLKKSNNKKFELNNKLQNDNNISEEIKNNKNNNIINDKNNEENNQIKEIFEEENNNEIKMINNEKNDINNEINNNSKVIKIIQKPIIKTKKNKISSILLNQENKNKKVILDLKEQKTLNLQEYLNQKSEDSNIFSSARELSSNRKNQYKSFIQNKKVNKVYKTNKFLNKMNEELTKLKINDRINTKIILNKEKLLTNIKQKIGKIITKENNQYIKHYNLFLTKPEMQKEMSTYVKEIFINRNGFILYEETYIYLLNKKSSNIFKCIIRNTLADYIFKKYEINKSSLTNKLKNEEIKENNLIQGFYKDKKLSNIKKNKTFLLDSNNEENKKNSYETLTIGKSKNVKMLRYFNKIENIIFIQDMILKSLHFYNENYIKFIISLQLNTNIPKRLSKFSSFDKGKRRQSVMKTKFNFLVKQNSLCSKNYEGNSPRKRGQRRTGSILKLEAIRKTMKISKKKSELKKSNFSILERKDFFKKIRPNKDNCENIIEKDSTNSHEKDKAEVNEIDSQLESIYFQLMKAIFDGNSKFFKDFYNKNKDVIDINQIVLEGNTFLLLAVKEGNYQITKFLCEENADVNIQNNEGNTALHYAIGKQFYSLADILTMHGAKEDLLNLKGYSPWDCIEHNVD